jgi:hypothetical protein
MPTISAAQLLDSNYGRTNLNDAALHVEPTRAPLAWSFRWLEPRRFDDATWELTGVSDSADADLEWWCRYLTGTADDNGHLIVDGWLTLYSKIRFPHAEAWLLRLDRPATAEDDTRPAPMHLSLRQEISFSRWLRDRAECEPATERTHALA